MTAILDFGGHFGFQKLVSQIFIVYFIDIYLHATFDAFQRKFSDSILFPFNKIHIEM